MRRLNPQHQHRQAGFTVIELMVATLIFAVILLGITVGVIHFTRSYYKGVNSSTTQNTTRSITDTISQAIQFSAADPITVTAFGKQSPCIGNQLFVPFLGSEVSSSQHGVVQFTVSSCTAIPTNITTGHELLQHYMHLADLTVTQSAADPSIWSVSVKLAYGSNDAGGTNSILCAPTAVVNSCNVSSSLSAANLADPTVLKDLHCKASAGTQFCAVSGLTTAVQRRLYTSG